MIRRFRYLGTWIWFALVGWLIVLVLTWAPAAWVGAELLQWAEPSPRALGSALVLAWFTLAVVGTALSRSREARGQALEPLEHFGRFLRVLVLLAVLALVTRGVMYVMPEGNDLTLAAHLDALFAPAWTGLDTLARMARLPTEVAGLGVAPPALFVLLLLSGNALRWRLDRLRHSDWHQRVLGEAAERARQGGLDPEEEARARSAERKVALASYSEARSVLESAEVELSFLSLDIVGSTGMKEGEDPYVVEQSFGAYRKLVERALRNHGAWKQTWTPDGQMAAFRSPEAAVECAKEVLSALPRFNREVSSLKAPFRVRIGGNLGTVSTDDHTPMEAISDFSIDVTGHLQKHAEPDSIWVSEELLERLDDPTGFRPVDREVDGRKVHSWSGAGEES